MLWLGNKIPTNPPLSNRQIYATFTSPPANEDSYLLEVSSDAGQTWAVLAESLAGGTTTFTDSLLPPGTVRHYRLSASNSEGISPAATTHGATISLPRDYFWRPGGTPNAGGIWDSATANWLSNSAQTHWPNGTLPANNARFGAVTTTRTVSIPEGATIHANSLVFESLRDGFGVDRIFEGPGSLVLHHSAVIDPSNGQNAVALNVPIAGSEGLTLAGSGSRNTNAETRLSGNNSYTGITKIHGSILAALSPFALGATGPGNHTEIHAGGRLLLAGLNGTPTPIEIGETIHLKNTADNRNSSVRSRNADNILSGELVNEIMDAGVQVNTPNTLTLSGNVRTASLGGPSVNRRLSLLANGGASSMIRITGVVADAPDGTRTRLLIDGNSNGTLSGSVELASANTLTGGIVIRRGTLLVSHPGAVATVSDIILGDGGLGDSTNFLRLLTKGPVTIDGNIFINTAAGNNTYTAVLGGSSADLSSFTGQITINDSNPGAYRLLAAAGGTVNFSGRITDGSQSKAIGITGGGVVVFSRPAGNTYDGGTTVFSGTLVAANTSGSATGTGPVLVHPGAFIGGNGIISGAATLQETAGLAFTLSSNASAHKPLQIGGALALGGPTILTITDGGNCSPGAYVLVSAAGGITGPPPEVVLPSG